MRKGFKPIFTITNRITARLTPIERAPGFQVAATHGRSRPLMVRDNNLPYGGEKP
jgi:hypothetical protein